MDTLTNPDKVLSIFTNLLNTYGPDSNEVALFRLIYNNQLDIAELLDEAVRVYREIHE